MKITVTTSSQTLKAILDAASKMTIVNGVIDESERKYRILFKNLGTQTVHIEMGEDATVANSIGIVQNATMSIDAQDLSQIHLIADGGSNTDFRLIVT